jgi:hypothetical protein
MTEALVLVGIGSLLVCGVTTLAIATLTLRQARRYVELAEERLEYLREEQARLVVLLLASRQIPQEEPKQEHHARHEHEGRARDLRARRDAEWRIDQLKRELLGLPEVRQESSSSVAEASFEDAPGARERLKEKTRPTQKVQCAGTPQVAGWPATTSSKPAEGSPGDRRPRLAVWHAHPDDDVSPGKAPAGRARVQGDAPLKMFHTYYDRYLQNYEGYVKLAERLYLMRDSGEVSPSSAAEHEWEEKLRRANDGIERTTARLDLLEEYNPELATDDRISRRASVARSHSRLESISRGGKGANRREL